MSTTPELRDPVCGVKLNQTADLVRTNYDGNTYIFCSTGCKDKFDANPHLYVHEVATNAPALEVQGAEQRCELPLPATTRQLTARYVA